MNYPTLMQAIYVLSYTITGLKEIKIPGLEMEIMAEAALAHAHIKLKKPR